MLALFWPAGQTWLGCLGVQYTVVLCTDSRQLIDACILQQLLASPLQALLQQRNLLAAHMAPGAALPPLLRDERKCARCFQVAACTLVHKVCWCEMLQGL